VTQVAASVTPMDRAPVDAAAVRGAASGWANIRVVSITESTNADLLDDPEAPDRSVLVAEHQRAGRGRLDRAWVSPPRAGLTFSVLLRPQAPIATWGWLPLLTGVALHSAVRDVTATAVALKWPNDLLCRQSGKKLAGILAQSSGAVVVLGIGLNVTTTAAELPVGTATSLALCGARVLDRTRLLCAILAELAVRVTHFELAAGDAEASGLAETYRGACSTLGRNVAVTTTEGARLVGNALAIDAMGRLQLALHGGVQTVGAGDVEHLRPAG
jgi:BirA family biotin operon repressor/biotin-[acetyl-CoA-carboxylase] ligase